MPLVEKQERVRAGEDLAAGGTCGGETEKVPAVTGAVASAGRDEGAERSEGNHRSKEREGQRVGGSRGRRGWLRMGAGTTWPGWRMERRVGSRAQPWGSCASPRAQGGQAGAESQSAGV